MRSVVVLSVFLLAVGCGKEIGDECVVSSDCDPSGGTRQCIDASEGGYCTVMGCDYSTCPEESVCVRFFTNAFENKDCQSNNDCSLDELCNINKKCVPRSSEVRYCMRVCDSPGESPGDCRDGYECRDFGLMQTHGGEPVLEPGIAVDETTAPSFCALAP